MGWRFRKSINLGGGFRVNLSKNGIGYSWGFKGYRITKTSDGRTRRTVSIPGTGISYVEEHGKSQGGGNQHTSQQSADPYAAYSDIQKVVLADANTFRSSEYDKLFKHIKLVKSLVVLFMVLAILTIAIPPLCVLLLALLVILLIKGRFSIIYEFDEVEQQRWEKVSAAWRAVAASKSLQEVTSIAKSKKARTSGGIENAVDTVKITSGKSLPWYLRTNIVPIVFKLHDRQLAIMPDRLIIFGKKQFGALDYRRVRFDISAFGFLEGGPVPSDSEVIKTVWAYTNNDGSPDRRYTNNKQYPVVKYGKIIISSPDGLNIQILCSNESASDALNEILNSTTQEG